MSQASERAANLALHAIDRYVSEDGWVTAHEIAPAVWSGERYPTVLAEGTLELLLQRGLVERKRDGDPSWVLWRLTEAGRRALASEEGSV